MHRLAPMCQRAGREREDTASLRVPKKSAKLSATCWKPGVCWLVSVEWLGELEHTNSVYLLASTGCTGQRVGGGGRATGE